MLYICKESPFKKHVHTYNTQIKGKYTYSYKYIYECVHNFIPREKSVDVTRWKETYNVTQKWKSAKWTKRNYEMSECIIYIY